MNIHVSSIIDSNAKDSNINQSDALLNKSEGSDVVDNYLNAMFNNSDAEAYTGINITLNIALVNNNMDSKKAHNYD